MARYFKLTDDVEIPGRWFLADPVDRNGKNLNFVFSQGRPASVEGPVRLQIAERGNPVDYSELAIERVPVVHARVAESLVSLASDDVQIIPVQIKGHPDQFCILNVTREIPCIDDKRSRHVVRYTQDDDEVFANRVGEYRDVRGLRIDETKVGSAQMFRPWGWHVALIVSKAVKDTIERIGAVGARFEEV